LNLPAEVYESDGVMSGAGRVRLGGVLTSNLVITLESGEVGRLEVPETVTVMAGQNSVSFDLTLVDNEQTEGLRTVSLTARAPGFNSALGALSIADDDVHHFVFGPVDDPQTAGIAFEVSLSARDIDERLITRFEGVAAMGARRGEMGLSV
jgi:hypothetical protein